MLKMINITISPTNSWKKFTANRAEKVELSAISLTSTQGALAKQDLLIHFLNWTRSMLKTIKTLALILRISLNIPLRKMRL